MHAALAQINIARLKAPLTDPALAGFVNRLDEINQLAERSDGFIWRLKDEQGDATSIQAFEDPDLIVNLSLWRDVASLKRYVYESTHLELLKARNDWFIPFASDDPLAHQALWWVNADTRPTVSDAKQRLSMIKTSGAGPLAFSFARPWPVPVVLHPCDDPRLGGATERDGRKVRDLLAQHALPVEDLDDTRWRHGAWTWFVVARVDGVIVGAGALEPVGPYRLLRSVVVAAHLQGKGLGDAIVTALLRIGSTADGIYLLTETATDYFAQRGFAAVGRDGVPEPITRTAQFDSLCPDTATVMACVPSST